MVNNKKLARIHVHIQQANKTTSCKKLPKITKSSSERRYSRTKAPEKRDKCGYYSGHIVWTSNRIQTEPSGRRTAEEEVVRWRRRERLQAWRRMWVCLCVGKRKSDHVTSLIHPPAGLQYSAGQRNDHRGSDSGSSAQPHSPFWFLHGAFLFLIYLLWEYPWRSLLYC